LSVRRDPTEYSQENYMKRRERERERERKKAEKRDAREKNIHPTKKRTTM